MVKSVAISNKTTYDVDDFEISGHIQNTTASITPSERYFSSICKKKRKEKKYENKYFLNFFLFLEM